LTNNETSVEFNHTSLIRQPGEFSIYLVFAQMKPKPHDVKPDAQDDKDEFDDFWDMFGERRLRASNQLNPSIPRL
jgi:hypothetical protein